MKLKPLTERQTEILEYCEAEAETLYPSIRKIAQHFNVYPATIQDHLNAIERKGISLTRKRRTTKRD